MSDGEAGEPLFQGGRSHCLPPTGRGSGSAGAKPGRRLASQAAPDRRRSLPACLVVVLGPHLRLGWPATAGRGNAFTLSRLHSSLDCYAARPFHPSRSRGGNRQLIANPRSRERVVSLSNAPPLESTMPYLLEICRHGTAKTAHHRTVPWL